VSSSNFLILGAAFLVKNKLEGGKEYIAKKILMGALETKQQQGALMEVNLLKNLSHPNIVGYKTSYIHSGLLIIIMEYCEVGDLSFHIKRRQAK
jgi:NIMA (never in mitosis gene a)-related kinase